MPGRVLSEHHTQLAKMSFDKISDLAAGVFLFLYYNFDVNFQRHNGGKASCPVFFCFCALLLR